MEVCSIHLKEIVAFSAVRRRFIPIQFKFKSLEEPETQEVTVKNAISWPSVCIHQSDNK